MIELRLATADLYLKNDMTNRNSCTHTHWYCYCKAAPLAHTCCPRAPTNPPHIFSCAAETQSRSLQLIQSEGAAEVSKVASEVVYTLNTSDSVDNFVEYIMTDIIAAQARLHSFVDKRFALPATSLHTDMISKWAHDNVVLDWDAYAAACGFPYCDQFDKKGVAVRITEFLAVVGGLWSIILIFSAGLYSCAQRLLGLECNEYAWVPPSGAQHAAHVPGSQGIV